VGKLNKHTTEADVREYFTRFGYVMDVYMPRDKVHRTEHRGFGFVTFETEAAVHRVAMHGTHTIKGSVVAIDSAVPRHEDSMVMGEDEVSNILSAGRLGLFSNEIGPARHHGSERPRHNFRPY
jgi:RNA-binding protein Musashi